jgi:hypothetical protein
VKLNSDGGFEKVSSMSDGVTQQNMEAVFQSLGGGSSRYESNANPVPKLVLLPSDGVNVTLFDAGVHDASPTKSIAEIGNQLVDAGVGALRGIETNKFADPAIKK